MTQDVFFLTKRKQVKVSLPHCSKNDLSLVQGVSGAAAGLAACARVVAVCSEDAERGMGLLSVGVRKTDLWF